jgi:hypothetical protein
VSRVLQYHRRKRECRDAGDQDARGARTDLTTRHFFCAPF